MKITDIKCGLLSQHLFKRTQEHGGCTNLWVAIDLKKKKCLPVITWNKKHSSNQVVLKEHILGKYFFEYFFKGLRDFFFQTE